MGWTRTYRLGLESRANNGDREAAAKLQRMRERNLENKRRSDAKLKEERAAQVLQKSVAKAVEKRLSQIRPKDATEESTMPQPISHPPPRRASQPPVIDLTSSPTPPPPTCSTSAPLLPLSQLVKAEVIFPAAQGVDSRHLGFMDGFEGVKWKPLSEVRGGQAVREELEKVRAIEVELERRKVALMKLLGIMAQEGVAE